MVRFLLPALLAAGLLRLVYAPAKWTVRLALHSGSGLLCLWILNLVSDITGILLPINGVTVLIAGFLGLPGIGLIALLEVLPV